MALLVAFLVFAAPKASQPTQNQAAPETEITPIVAIKQKELQEQLQNIIYTTRDGVNTKIFKVSENGGNPQLLYSDTKDQNKFKAVSGIKNDGSVIYLLVGPTDQEFNGKLIEITTDAKATEKTIRDNISFTTPPLISPIGDKFAIISFSNAEANIGFSVITEDRDGSNQKTIYKSQETISLVDWALDGKKLAIVKASPTGGSQVIVADLANNTAEGIYSTAGLILTLDFETTGVVVGEAPSGAGKANETELIKFDADGKNVTRLTTNTSAEISVNFDPDTKEIAYIQLTYTDGLASAGLSGNLTKMIIDAKAESIIGKATGVIGWTR